MALKSLSEIAQNLINSIHDTLPDIDTKEGTFIRDVFINPTSNEIAALYEQILSMQLSQSILTASGSDLDNLSANYFIDRKQSTRSYGSVRFYLKMPVTQEIIIPKGTNVSTIGTTTNQEKIFETTETIVVPIGYSVVDANRPKYCYVDIASQSTFPGDSANVGSSDIKKIQSSIDQNVVSVENLLPFTGGTDTESDVSLALRVSLAISGSNIGTKDGYTSFILKQPEVIDARIVAAGDPLMRRDNGMGGMVDIYVRAEKVQEETYNIEITRDYITDQTDVAAYSPILLPMQPVLKISDIKGTVAGSSQVRNYVNGSNYDVERISNKYYLDKVWNFTDSIGDNTTIVGSLLISVDGGTTKIIELISGDNLATVIAKINTAFNAGVAINAFGKLSIVSPTIGLSSSIDIKSASTTSLIKQLGLPLGVNNGTSTLAAVVLGTNSIDRILTEEEDAARILNVSLKRVRDTSNYLRDVYADLNWAQIKPNDDAVLPADPDFLRGFDPDHGYVYQIKSKPKDSINVKVGNRYFVRKDSLIYERTYYNPDFILLRDTTDYSYSYISKDSIKWLDNATNKPGEAEQLAINYSYSGVVNDLQLRIDEKRVLTADVLVMSARKVGLEIYAEIVPYQNYSPETVKASIINNITSYINNTRKLGGVISVSDIVFIIRGTSGVDDVGLDTIKLARVNEMPSKQIIALDYEYLEVSRVTINVFPIGTTL